MRRIHAVTQPAATILLTKAARRGILRVRNQDQDQHHIASQRDLLLGIYSSKSVTDKYLGHTGYLIGTDMITAIYKVCLDRCGCESRLLEKVVSTWGYTGLKRQGDGKAIETFTYKYCVGVLGPLG